MSVLWVLVFLATNKLSKVTNRTKHRAQIAQLFKWRSIQTELGKIELRQVFWMGGLFTSIILIVINRRGLSIVPFVLRTYVDLLNFGVINCDFILVFGKIMFAIQFLLWNKIGRSVTLQLLINFLSIFGGV